MQTLIQFQIPIRVSICLILFALLSVWESRYFWRPWLEVRIQRWGRHFGMNIISKFFLLLLFPGLVIAVAVHAQQKQMGILHNLPPVMEHDLIKIILSIVIIDFFMYVQHRWMHRYRILWRFHRVHHIDRELDVSTGLRFHPVEELYTTSIKMLAVIFLGAPLMAVFIFEVWYNFATLFMHLNVKFKNKIEKALRKVFVTPGMHRVHHSDNPLEYNSNFSFIFNFWDKLFDSYRYEAIVTERKMVIGLEEFKEPKYANLINLLLVPFNLKRLKPRLPKHTATKMKGL